jgi:leader peptidase (prepilin peptidase)/N-methyltransferase
VGAVVSELTGARVVPLIGVASVGPLSHPLAAAVVGMLLGVGVSAAIAGLYGAVRNRSGLGMGDVKLLGALGLFLGPYVLVALFFGSLLGIVAGIAVASKGSRLADTKIPFGPWLSAGAVLAVIFGPAALGWYLHLVGIL